MNVLGIYTSPRRDGNSDLLMKELLRGAKDAGAEVSELFARKLNIKLCVACDRCIELGHCFQEDDYGQVVAALNRADAVAFATPVHFYTVGSHAKVLIDRIQAEWNKKYVTKIPEIVSRPERPGALIAVGATKGKKLFEGLRMTVYYFFDAAGIKLKHELCVPGIDHKGAILEQPELLKQAYDMGRALAGG
jgi:multimeric flavodoxin WrbA